MKTIKTKEIPAGGSDQRWEAPDNSASEIVNMRLDPEGFGWINDRGFEPFIEDNTKSTTLATPSSYSDLFVWQRHRGSELYVISKRSNNLMYEVANNSGLTSNLWKPEHTIAFNRTPSKPDDPGEQYIPFGRICIIMNGKDPILKFWGRDRVEPFGFTSTTPTPEVLGPDPKYFDGTCDLTASPPTSTYDYNSNNTIGGIVFDRASGTGLGDKDENTVSHYRYKISFITDTGSESPLSSYTQVSWDNLVNGNTYATYFQNLPMGPPGTVGRRIYRTKNMGSLRGEVVDDTYYLVTQIDDNVSRNYYDVKPDQLLVVPAPDSAASSVISNSYKYGASWDGRVWMAGGQGTETKIIYSDQGLPEQFGQFSYFDVGNKKGGAITALFPYYDNLLIFREMAIEVIRPAGSGTYVCTTLNGNIGTTATNAITSVHGKGIFFLSYDGVYTFAGGTLGGSQVSVVRISDPISKELSRLSKGSLAKASASYSDKEKEWWCLYPVDGETVTSRSCVYHTLNDSWSFRNNFEDADLMTYNNIATLPDGWFILAPRIKTSFNSPQVGQNTSTPNGLMIWSARRSIGQSVTWQLVQGTPTIISTTNGSSIMSQWQSAWLNFGDDSPNKRILSVEVEVLTQGHNEVELLSAFDYRSDETSAGLRATAFAPLYGSINEDALFTPATGPFDKSTATIGTTRWGEYRSTKVRWDVSSGLVGWYRFTLKSRSIFQIISFVIHYTGSDMPTLNMVAGQRKTI